MKENFKSGFYRDHRASECRKIHTDESSDRTEDRDYIRRNHRQPETVSRQFIPAMTVRSSFWIHRVFTRQKTSWVNIWYRLPNVHLKDVDVILWLVEPTTFIGAGERHIAEQLQGLHIPVILVINKVDTVRQG